LKKYIFKNKIVSLPPHTRNLTRKRQLIEPRVSSATGWKRKLWDRLASLASFLEVASSTAPPAE